MQFPEAVKSIRSLRGALRIMALGMLGFYMGSLVMPWVPACFAHTNRAGDGQVALTAHMPGAHMNGGHEHHATRQRHRCPLQGDGGECPLKSKDKTADCATHCKLSGQGSAGEIAQTAGDFAPAEVFAENSQVILFENLPGPVTGYRNVIIDGVRDLPLRPPRLTLA